MSTTPTTVLMLLHAPNPFPQESIYPATFYDAQGAPLTGANGTRYTIHFPGPLPYDAAKGWWSLIAYNKQAALIANPINRQALNDRTQGLKVNKDGSFTVYVQAEQPTDPVRAVCTSSYTQNKMHPCVCVGAGCCRGCRGSPSACLNVSLGWCYVKMPCLVCVWLCSRDRCCACELCLLWV